MRPLAFVVLFTVICNADQLLDERPSLPQQAFNTPLNGENLRLILLPVKSSRPILFSLCSLWWHVLFNWVLTSAPWSLWREKEFDWLCHPDCGTHSSRTRLAFPLQQFHVNYYNTTNVAILNFWNIFLEIICFGTPLSCFLK